MGNADINIHNNSRLIWYVYQSISNPRYKTIISNHLVVNKGVYIAVTVVIRRLSITQNNKFHKDATAKSLRCPPTFITSNTNAHESFIPEWFLSESNGEEEKVGGFCLVREFFLPISLRESIAERKERTARSRLLSTSKQRRAETLPAILTNGRSFVPLIDHWYLTLRVIRPLI